MADLKLTADFTDLQTLKRELLDIPKKARDSARTFEAEFARAERILVKQARQFERNAQESQKFYSELLKLNSATKDAERSAQVFVRELEKEERAAAKAKTNYERLRATFDSSYAARMRLRQASQTLRAAVDAEIISVQEAAAMLRQYNAAANSSSVAATDLARRMNRQGVITQQAGYQLGDFIVQVQSGTNWMVAFGQQATQVAGTLTLLQGKWVLIGSVLGVVIPLLTAIGAAFLRTRQEADTSADSIDDLEGRLKSLDNTLRDYLRTREAARMGITAEQLLGTEGIEDAEQKLESARKALEDIRRQREAIRVLGGGLGAFEFGRNLFAGGSPEDLEAAALAKLIEAENRLATLRQKQQEEQFKTFSERLLQYEEEIALQREIAKFGRDSAQVQKLEREQALAAEIRRINELERAQEINEDQANILRESARILSEIEQTTKSAADEAKRFADNLVLGQQYLANAVRAGVASGAIPPQALNSLPQTAGEKAYQDLMERRRGEYYANQDKESRGRGGGRSRAAKEQEDYLLNLQKEAELKLQMIGLSEQEQRRLELVHELTTRNLPVEDERIQKLIATEAALRQAMEAEERREQLMNSIQGNLEAGFMAMIDGSKSVEDAFKSMIRAILVDIAQQAIVKPIASGITSFLFPGRASGGSMMAGKPYLVGESGPELVIPSRGSTVANANLTGDAMGGGQAVVINQTFQFSANGDDSVKRIIAAEAPKIAALTQKQIVDQRRRGGQMRSVFG